MKQVKKLRNLEKIDDGKGWVMLYAILMFDYLLD